MATTLQLMGLPRGVSEPQVRRICQQKGVSITSVRIEEDERTGGAVAFVTLAAGENPQRSEARLNTAIEGRQISARLVAADRPDAQSAAGRQRRAESPGRAPGGGRRFDQRPPRREQAVHAEEAITITGPRFVHVYNFTEVPADGLGGAAGVQPFARQEPAHHDRWEAERFSGHIDCRLVTQTPWFIPDARKVDAPHDHKTLGYFTLDAVDRSSWSSEQPEADGSRPAIPASSLRGMIRSVFETATLSCFSVFDEGRLDYRVGFSPDYVPRGTAVPHGRSEALYCPVRVARRDPDGSIIIEKLDGRHPRDPQQNTIPAGFVSAYTPKVFDKSAGAGQDDPSTPGWQTVKHLRDGPKWRPSFRLLPSSSDASSAAPPPSCPSISETYYMRPMAKPSYSVICIAPARISRESTMSASSFDGPRSTIRRAKCRSINATKFL